MKKLILTAILLSMCTVMGNAAVVEKTASTATDFSLFTFSATTGTAPASDQSGYYALSLENGTTMRVSYSGNSQKADLFTIAAGITTWASSGAFNVDSMIEKSAGTVAGNVFSVPANADNAKFATSYLQEYDSTWSYIRLKSASISYNQNTTQYNESYTNAATGSTASEYMLCGGANCPTVAAAKFTSSEYPANFKLVITVPYSISLVSSGTFYGLNLFGLKAPSSITLKVRTGSSASSLNDYTTCVIAGTALVSWGNWKIYKYDHACTIKAAIDSPNKFFYLFSYVYDSGIKYISAAGTGESSYAAIDDANKYQWLDFPFLFYTESQVSDTSKNPMKQSSDAAKAN